MKNFSPFGLFVPEILLPKKDIDLASWAVVACDQYTQDRDYWKEVEAKAQGASTLHLILPEVYLADEDKSQRIEAIRSTMKKYLRDGIFRKPLEGFIYLERATGYGRVRRGLVVAVDLESYEWKPFSSALIRATEATIPDRIPPRMEIRRGAALELPHIMLLVNDKSGSLVEACGTTLKDLGVAPIYEGDLMMGAGHIVGYPVEEKALEGCHSALQQLAVENTSAQGDTFLFAVGDGNHSLATAKAVWDEYKEGELAGGKSLADLKSCTLRYALVEIVNIYDEGLTFEPIHRVLFGCRAIELMDYCCKNLEGSVEEVGSSEELVSLVENSSNSFGFVFKDDTGAQKFYCLKTEIKGLAVSRLQPVLDEFLAGKKDGEIDYIHGTDEVFRLGSQPGTVAILLPPVAKDSFFSTIGSGGPLPRKSFSMGEASEKRFYLEARRI
ncbi:MAG: DUF1015 domain-containing protein [Spirochaetaceae bacterium]|nr:DUF1015 domain-containing protein [Spirochaetaceae bacterium]